MPVKAASLFTRLFVIITLMCPDEVACNLMMLVLHAVHLPIRGKLYLLHLHIELLYAKTKEPLRIPHFFWRGWWWQQLNTCLSLSADRVLA